VNLDFEPQYVHICKGVRDVSAGTGVAGAGRGDLGGSFGGGSGCVSNMACVAS